MEEQRNPTPQARSSNLRVEPITESYPGRAGSRRLSALCLHRHGDRALNSPPSGSGIDGCAPVFHTGEAGSMPAARSISPPSSTLVRIWRGAVDAVSAVRVRGLVHRRDVMAALRPPKPPVGVQVPAPVPFGSADIPAAVYTVGAVRVRGLVYRRNVMQHCGL